VNSPARTLRVEHHLDLGTIAKILLGCELPAQPSRRDVRPAITAALAAHGRLGALHRFDLQRRDAAAAGTVQQLRQRLAACRHLAEQAFPARASSPKGRPLIEALYRPDNP
jgi:hypothetical protein